MSKGLEDIEIIRDRFVEYKNKAEGKDIKCLISPQFAQVRKELKALEIIKEKRVDLPYLRCCIEDNQSVERYNEYIRNKTIDYDHEQELTEEEFNTLKEVLE